ncbi:hypothetical protein Zmor_019497 [Zophobas morio]|uniref:Uncharacterized protein n=1 Tax=Zophobas morio TaxID=2755281 RepID=A0AA38M8Y1_9CUCU|nr:hypothetical protein Zmor_019497 [Zophobas morio]
MKSIKVLAAAQISAKKPLVLTSIRPLLFTMPRYLKTPPLSSSALETTHFRSTNTHSSIPRAGNRRVCALPSRQWNPSRVRPCTGKREEVVLYVGGIFEHVRLVGQLS